jgi:hypothetical protein
MKHPLILLFLAALFLTSCGPSEEFLQLEQENASLLTDISTAESQITVLSTEREANQTEIDSLEGEKNGLQSDLDSAKEENFQLAKTLDLLVCEKQIENMSYDAILESTSRLEAYVNGLNGVEYTSGGFRDTIYSNADSKIHAIRYNSDDGNQYIMTFLVFYDEFNWEPSTFFVDQQCWIDPPVRIPASESTSQK